MAVFPALAMGNDALAAVKCLKRVVELLTGSGVRRICGRRGGGVVSEFGHEPRPSLQAVPTVFREKEERS